MFVNAEFFKINSTEHFDTYLHTINKIIIGEELTFQKLILICYHFNCLINIVNLYMSAINVEDGEKEILK